MQHKHNRNVTQINLESELVSGFMTEHAAVIFVFFFLAEYASIVLICTLVTILFIGGYNFIYIYYIIDNLLILSYDFTQGLLYSLVKGLLHGTIIGLKTCLMIFVFIWVRASFPRIRFDQLMLFCWTILLPIVIALIIIVPCIIYTFDILPSNSNLL